jgi:uncharacterized protein YaiL (DUF2058 family)
MGAKISQPSTRKRLSSHFSKDSNSKDQSQVSKLTLDDQLPRTSSVSSREMLWFDSTQKGEQDRMNAVCIELDLVSV